MKCAMLIPVPQSCLLMLIFSVPMPALMLSQCYGPSRKETIMRVPTMLVSQRRWIPTARLSLALGCLLPACAAQAQTTLTFENAPTKYIHNGGGKQNLGSYYSGVTFSNMQVLDSASGFLPYNSSAFPPHSGTAVAGYFSGKASDVTFAAPVSDVSFYYTVASGVNDVSVTDMALGGVTSTFLLPSNPGSSDLFSFMDTGITQLIFKNGAAVLTLDDLTFTPSPLPVPEAASAVPLGMGMVLLAALWRRSRAQAKAW